MAALASRNLAEFELNHLALLAGGVVFEHDRVELPAHASLSAPKVTRADLGCAQVPDSMQDLGEGAYLSARFGQRGWGSARVQLKLQKAKGRPSHVAWHDCALQPPFPSGTWGKQCSERGSRRVCDDGSHIPN